MNEVFKSWFHVPWIPLAKSSKQCNSKISNPIPIKIYDQTLTLRLSFFNRIINLRKICIPVTILKFMCSFEWILHCTWALSGDDLINTYLVTSRWIYKADSDFFVKLWLKFAFCEKISVVTLFENSNFCKSMNWMKN